MLYILGLCDSARLRFAVSATGGYHLIPRLKRRYLLHRRRLQWNPNNGALPRMPRGTGTPSQCLPLWGRWPRYSGRMRSPRYSFRSNQIPQGICTATRRMRISLRPQAKFHTPSGVFHALQRISLSIGDLLLTVSRSTLLLFPSPRPRPSRPGRAHR